MDKRPFLNQSSKPTEAAIQSALREMYAFYQRVLELAGSYSKEWGFTKSSGWMLKVYDHQKALFYLIPLNGAYKISLTLRESERNAFLADDELTVLHERLASAKKFVEGFAVQLDIGKEEDYPLLEKFIGKLMNIRGR